MAKKAAKKKKLTPEQEIEERKKRFEYYTTDADLPLKIEGSLDEVLRVLAGGNKKSPKK